MLSLFAAIPITLMAAPIKIKTVLSYVETPTLGKSYQEKTVVFEVDTLAKTLVVKSVLTTSNYKMTNFHPTINNEKVTLIKFDVEVGKTMTKKYVIRIPKPLAGNKITVRETMVTASREMPSTTYMTDTYDQDPHYETKYISMYFHDIKETSPTSSHRCSVMFNESVVMIADYEGTSEMRMLQVYSVENPSTDKEKRYHCKGNEGDFLFEVTDAKNEYSTPVFRLTRLIDGKPVVTTEYFGDFIE